MASLTLQSSSSESLPDDDISADLVSGLAEEEASELQSSIMAQAVPNAACERKRVKVYELRHNDWFDRGTGFCYASVSNGNLCCLARITIVSCAIKLVSTTVLTRANVGRQR